MPSISSQKKQSDANKTQTAAQASEQCESPTLKHLGWATQVSPITRYAANSTLVPALMNTPITTSLARPLVQSQVDGKPPQLNNILSTRGWLPALGRTGVRYAIADTARSVSAQAVAAVIENRHQGHVGELSDADERALNALVDTGAAALMTGASQPLTALQVYRQVQEQPTAAGRDRFIQGLLAHPFRGSGGNFLSTFLMFNLDRNDRRLIGQRERGEISPARVTAIQLGLGGATGVVSNFLKTHANGRALGLSHQEIFQKIMQTAKINPSVFALQTFYAWVLGGVANKLWASSIATLKSLDQSVQDKSPE